MWFIICLMIFVAESLSLFVPPEYADEWNQFKSQYQKKYLNDVDESNHYKTYIENVERISKHNKMYKLGLVAFKQSINEFSDMAHEDFLKKMTGNIQSNTRFGGRRNLKKSGKLKKSAYIQAEESKDWRNYGYVTPVKNQGGCGSCWAFGATGVLEGQYFKKTGKLVSLSEQNLLDCTSGSCNGSHVSVAFKYVDKYGIMSEESYPYEGVKHECKRNSKKNILKVKKAWYYKLDPPGNEKKLMEKSSTFGPISVVINATPDSLKNYGGGIYSDPKCSSSELNHRVLLVGYGSERGSDFWIVKNSWGKSWGENGYIRIARNKKNMCGIATDAWVMEL